MKSIIYVVNENIRNVYRILSISKYELLSDMRDSKLGIIWNILNPLIQVSTYWFVFGIGIRGGEPVSGVEFLDWMMAGLLVWFFIGPCITKGVNAISSKINVITKMKFPISILPATVVLKELFNHCFMLVIVYFLFLIRGMRPSIYNLQVLYYIICIVTLATSLSMITASLNVFTKDVRKMVNASMRILMYLTPILWTMDKLPVSIKMIMKCNPIFYIVEGYRDCFFYHKGILATPREMAIFWLTVAVLFIIGSNLIYKFKHKFIDLL